MPQVDPIEEPPRGGPPLPLDLTKEAELATSRSVVRFGVLGTARIARRLVAEMQATEGVSVAAIASRDGARGKWYAQQYGIGTACEGYAELLARPEINAVYIPLPPALHAEWAIAAAEAGKHILCEKPLAICESESRRIAETCALHGVQWLDATAWLHHERTDAMAQSANLDLGKLKHISAAVTFFEPFQTDDHRLKVELGGGCLLDLGWYAIGCGIWATGMRPKIVAASGAMRNRVWYRISALLEWPQGITGMINCGFDVSSRKWFEVAGDERSLVCDDFTRPWASRPNRFWLHNRAGEVESRTVPGNQELGMLRHFRDAIEGKLCLKSFQEQCLQTQATLDDLAVHLAGTQTCG